MKKYKSFRIFATLMAVLLLTMSLFTGCGSKESATDEAEDEIGWTADDKTDEEIVKHAIQNTLAEESIWDNLIPLELDDDDATETEISVNIDSVDEEFLSAFAGSGISTLTQNDPETDASYTKAGITFEGATIDLELYADEDEITVGSNLLGETALTVDLSENLVTQLLTSPVFSTYMSELSVEDLAEYTELFNKFTTEKADLCELAKYISAFFTSADTGYQIFLDSLKVTTSKECEMTYNEETVTATAYAMELQQVELAELLCDFLDYLLLNEDILNFAETMATVNGVDDTETNVMDAWTEAKEEILAEVEEETEPISIAITVYEDTVIRFSIVIPVTSDDSTTDALLESSIVYTRNGGSSMFADAEIIIKEVGVEEEDTEAIVIKTKEEKSGSLITGNVEITPHDEDNGISISVQASYDTESGAIEFSYEDSSSDTSVQISGMITENTTDAFAVSLDSIIIGADGSDELFVLNASFREAKLEGEVTTIDGEKVDVLEMTQETFYEICMTVIENLSSMEGMNELLSYVLD